MELNFQVIVLIIAIVLLILTLIAISSMLRRSKMSQQWPPVVGKCPDFWDIDSTGKMCNPINASINTGGGNTGGMNTGPLVLENYKNNCALYDWASTNKIVWDGLTSDGVKPKGCP